MHEWQPNTTFTSIKFRANIVHQIRLFFKSKEVLEVDTPLLSSSTVTDPYIQSFSTDYRNADGSFKKKLFLQTSPEFFMKRLLAAGSGPIYQISHAFRNQGEQGRWHNPEFSLLEWYRPGFTLINLIDELDDFFRFIGLLIPTKRMTYQELFQHYMKIDPHQISLARLHDTAKKIGIDTQSFESFRTKDDGLQYVLDIIIQRYFNKNCLLFLYDFPLSQCALARIRKDPFPVAERVEVYLNGLELANGYFELADVQEQKSRFLSDLENRQKNNTELVPIDAYLLDALEAGLPDCSGVALGLDRLIAILARKECLSEVLSFPLEKI